MFAQTGFHRQVRIPKNQKVEPCSVKVQKPNITIELKQIVVYHELKQILIQTIAGRVIYMRLLLQLHEAEEMQK